MTTKTSITGNAANAVCSVTGLLITSRPEWTDRKIGRRYRLTTQLIGHQILFTRPSGHAELGDVIEMVRVNDAIIQEVIGESADYVIIIDFSRIRSATRDARLYYSRYLRKRSNLMGVISFGASPLSRVLINLAKRLHAPETNIEFAKDYEKAMSAAVRMIRTGPAGRTPALLSSHYQDIGITEHYENGHHILRCDQWEFDGDDYNLIVEVIDGNIYHAISSGVLREHHVALIVQMRETVCSMVGIDHGFRAIITGTKDTYGSERSARKNFMASLKEWHAGHPMVLYVFYNANWFVRTASMMATPFMPFKIKLAPNLAGALSLVDRFSTGDTSIPLSDSSMPQPVDSHQQKVVNQLLRFLDNIDWERQGVPVLDHIDPQDPFRPVFDAITLIKGELDELSEKRRQAEKALREGQQRFTTVLDSVSAYIYVADLDTFEILFMNQAMRDDFGENYVGTSCFELFENAHGVCSDSNNEKLVDENGEPTGLSTWEGINPVTKRWYLNHDRAIRWVDGRLVRLRISTDISRIKNLESERIEITERLQQSRKIDAVSTMAGGVAHHFNNLLMVILGNLELMRLEVAEGSKLSKKIDTIEDSATRAADLSTLLLTYVGQTRISTQIIDLDTTLSEMVNVLKTTIRDKARLILKPSEEKAWIHADTSKTYEVITNLVNNAVEASGDQPLEIRISVDHRFCDRAGLDRIAPGQNLSEGHYVRLQVADNGQGMDEETLEKVFDPFFTTKFTGRGLGMATVMGIMRAHRGGVMIESSPNAGTTVNVYFPETKQTVPSLQEKEVEPLKREDTRNKGTIILVDDEPMVLELGKEMLKYMGFDVLTAEDGLEALTLFEVHRDQIRMAVLDVDMPRMGGRDTIKRMRERGATFPMLVASGYTDAQSREKLGDINVDGFLQKPFRVEELKEKINSIFDASGKVISPKA